MNVLVILRLANKRVQALIPMQTNPKFKNKKERLRVRKLPY